MMLEGSSAGSAIRWVREDLDASLEVVRDNLEAFAGDPTQRAALVAVQEELERLNLTFLTMQQQGASILTDEMIAVGGHMLHNGNASCQDSLNALTDAVIVLPSYLDRLQAGHEDLPILLLPTLNELRATYDETLLSEGTLFAPDLDVIIPELSGSEADAIADSDFAAFARRVRSLYQGALLGWLKEQSKESLLDPMQQVCRTLYTRLGRNGLRRLWWIAERAMQGLRDGSIDNDLPLRRLFARLDLTLKAMVDGGEPGPSEETVTALSRALLFYAAQARPGSKATDKLRERFQLEELIPDRDALLRARGAVTGRDASLFHSIGEAVREELGLVKDTLDMELRTGRVDEQQRAASRTSLRQLADTLEMLNLPVPARAVEDLLPALENTDGAGNMDLDSPLLGLAQKLIEVESILNTHIQLLGEPVDTDSAGAPAALSEHEQRQHLSTLLDECVVALHEVQEAVKNRLEGDLEADYASPLRQISGALSVASLSEVSGLTEKLERTLNSAFAGRAEVTDPVPHLETLADAVAALELYLTGYRDGQGDGLRFIKVMQDRLSGLPEADADGAPVPETSISPPAKPATVPAKEPAGAAGIDPAMLEIFVDEFDSVHCQLELQLGRWLEDHGNAKALAELRRGFHTLKGSGRMVGATEVGDFAWVYEDLLNKVIDGQLTPSESLQGAARSAVAALPALRARMLGEPANIDEAGIQALVGFARQIAGGGDPDPAILQTLSSATTSEPVATPTPDEASVPADQMPAAAAADEQPESSDAMDPTLRHLMIGEIRGHLSELEDFVKALLAGSDQAVSPDLVRAVHTLAGTLSMAPLGQEPEIARALEHYLENRLNSECLVTQQAAACMQHCLHRFHQRLSVLRDDNSTTYPREDAQLLDELANLALLEDEAAALPVEQVAEPETDSPPAPEVVEPAAAVEEQEQSEAADDSPLKVEDNEILSIFLDEAVEVLERCDSLLNTWRDKLSDRKLVQNLQREIHTFKGGARMAGLEGLGELSHAMESLLEQIASNRVEPTIAAVQALEEGCDDLNRSVEQLRDGRMPEVEEARRRFDKKVRALRLPVSEAQQTAGTRTERPARIDTPRKPGSGARDEAQQSAADAVQAQAPEDTAGAPAAEKADTLPETVSAASDRPMAGDMASAQQPAITEQGKPTLRPERKRELREIEDRPAATAEEAAPGAQIRVAAELMDKLVNYAGEVSIYRSRLEQQMGTVRSNLKEVDATVRRLKEQLRKMDIESEAQMMSRYQSATSKGAAEFDPLELDRFSNMQQLSRALAESVSDLLNLHEMLEESVRQAEGLLTQQSRVSSDLQEGLMQTRMTPFGSAAPRLRRVVRAAATETGKKARLQLRMAGSSDQLDRNVLERITAPLEHMLRNAVAHGIESPRVRRKLKKPEEGEISVTVEAEATEFVIRVQDDGSGIDLDAVRRRAIERGLIGKGEETDPKQLIQFIRESGFSTATSVTGLAGRGVGMDVVNSEIKQIGGSMEIETESGKGTRFTIRIPFSLAVMQAIGVSFGDRMFQIPLNSVAGVARVTPAEYSALLKNENPCYEFAGESFPLLELEPLLEAPPLPLDSDNVSLLMIRAGEQLAAFRVTELHGHQEIVVKPVGPQISSIPGILGGTIAADGQVMIILDMGPLIRRGLELATRPAEAAVPAQEEARAPLVMVVDDSITMRKVTSRVLANHSFEVLTAQDGVDAIERIYDRVPDLMLLDIEMPRMDGYQLLEHVRSDARLRHIPVVMITSRAGQKHRKKARSAGANAYLTKPYQEAELIEQVYEMLDIELGTRRLA